MTNLTEQWKKGEWARKLKISANLLYSRYYKNKDPEYIFRSI